MPRWNWTAFWLLSGVLLFNGIPLLVWLTGSEITTTDLFVFGIIDALALPFLGLFLFASPIQRWLETPPRSLPAGQRFNLANSSLVALGVMLCAFGIQPPLWLIGFWLTHSPLDLPALAVLAAIFLILFPFGLSLILRHVGWAVCTPTDLVVQRWGRRRVLPYDEIVRLETRWGEPAALAVRSKHGTLHFSTAGKDFSYLYAALDQRLSVRELTLPTWPWELRLQPTFWRSLIGGIAALVGFFALLTAGALAEGANPQMGAFMAVIVGLFAIGGAVGTLNPGQPLWLRCTADRIEARYLWRRRSWDMHTLVEIQPHFGQGSQARQLVTVTLLFAQEPSLILQARRATEFGYPLEQIYKALRQLYR